MGKLESSQASIGFYGDDLDPSDITLALGEPTVAVAKGEAWVNEYGTERTAKTGSWLLVAETREPEELDWQINDLLSRLNDDLVAWRSFAGRYRGRVFCGLFLASQNDGLTLRPETLVRIGERGLVVDLDIYGPVEPELDV
jgi:hypothetical protein